MQLLETLCNIHAPSGNEKLMKEFIVEYVNENSKKWTTIPEIIQGPKFQNCVILKFGKPRTAVFAHMDSIGFTVRYQNQLVPIGGPEAHSGFKLKGVDSLGPIECELEVNDNGQLFYKFGRAIDTGTDLVFACDFRQDEKSVTSCYLDNRLGVYSMLKVAETLEDGLLVFSCWEEHGGGSVPYLAKYMYEELNINQALISDITWVTEGVSPGKGVAISMRDRNIPRRSYIDHIIALSKESGIDYQLEVEGSGSSDGRELQISPYPIDWCFIGAPEDNVHSPDETVYLHDIKSMIDLYSFLLRKL
ncbi:MAG: M20/M25/M40 family metallo-hydrolase [Bacteroidota bacterium]